MGANFSLELVQSVGAFVFLCISYLEGLLLPDEHGASAFLPKVTDQLKKLDRLKVIDGEEFPGSSLSFSPSERCNWMTKLHEVRRPIGQILWPGTHYSATHKIGIPLITRPSGQRQTMSIIDQLVNGIRALDIRIQQDHRVCSGNMVCDTTIGDVISDIKLFLEKTKFEIIILEIQTERGFCDPENFEDYLVENFGDRLIHQDDQVFNKSISEVLPGRIICIWKPILNAFMPRQGGPIWSGKYLQCDEFDTQMPLTRFDGNIHNLKGRSAALKINYYFYKVENTLNPQVSTTLESLLVWPKYANVVSKRINEFSRLFLAKCNNDGTLPRLQVYSVDFVNDDFISACIGLSQESTTTQVSIFSDESSEIKQKIDQAALAESKRREDDLKNTLEVEKECRAKIEKAMHEMRAEAAETKVAGKMKLTETHSMVEDAQKKLAEAQAKFHDAESLQAEASRFHLSAERKLQEVEAREDDLRRRIISFKSECDAKESGMALEKQSLSERQRVLKDEQERLLDAQALLNQREGHLFSKSKHLDRFEKELDTLRAEIETERSALNEEKSNLNITLASLSRKEADAIKREVMLDKKEQELLILQENLASNKIEFNRPEIMHKPVGNMNISSSRYCNGINNKWDYNTSDNNNKTWASVVLIRIPPSKLKITSSEDKKQWKPIECTSDEEDEVAESIEIYSLNVSGTYKIKELQQGIKHEVYFGVKMEDWAFGWESPVHLRLILPDGSTQENQQTLDLSSNPQYLRLGNFIMSPKMMGEMKFSLERHGNTLMGGITIRGVFIQHVYNDIVVPRDLSIKFDDYDECWEWHDKWSRYTKNKNEIVSLKSVRNFEVRGVFETGKLSFGCTYRVAFAIWLDSKATGWENPTKLTLSLPNGSLQH